MWIVGSLAVCCKEMHWKYGWWWCFSGSYGLDSLKSDAGFRGEGSGVRSE